MFFLILLRISNVSGNFIEKIKTYFREVMSFMKYRKKCSTFRRATKDYVMLCRGNAICFLDAKGKNGDTQ